MEMPSSVAGHRIFFFFGGGANIGYHGVVFDAVVALLQLLQLQLSHVVLGDAGALCHDGGQQAVVAEHFLVQQLQPQQGSVISCGVGGGK